MRSRHVAKVEGELRDGVGAEVEALEVRQDVEPGGQDGDDV